MSIVLLLRFNSASSGTFLLLKLIEIHHAVFHAEPLILTMKNPIVITMIRGDALPKTDFKPLSSLP